MRYLLSHPSKDQRNNYEYIEMLKDKARRAVEGLKETVKKAVDTVPNF